MCKSCSHVLISLICKCYFSELQNMWSWESAATAGSLKIYGAWWDPSKNPQRVDESIAKPLSTIFGWPWKPREVPADWKLMKFSQFSERARRTTLVTTGLSVSLQCLVNLWRRFFWDVLTNTWKTMQSHATASMASWEESLAYQTWFRFMTR